MPARIRTLALAASLVGWKVGIAPRLPARWQVPVHAAASMGLAVVTGTPLGTSSPAVWRGLRFGAASVASVCAGVAVAARVPAVRRAMTARELPAPVWVWLLVRIPVGTVFSEEIAFRGVLGASAAAAAGPRWGRVVSAAAFGVSHVGDARATGTPVVGTVAVTSLAGWVFGWLHDRSRSLAAPMLAHLAINEAGAVAAVLAQRRHTSRACAFS